MGHDGASFECGGMLSTTEHGTQEKSSACLSKLVDRAAGLLLELSGYPVRVPIDLESPQPLRRLSSAILSELVGVALAIAELVPEVLDRLP